MNLPSLPELRAIVRSLGLPALRGIQHIDRQWSVERHRLSFEGGQQEVILARQLWHTGLRPLDAEAAAIQALIAEDFPAASGMQLLPDGAMDRPATLRVHTPGSPNTHGPSALAMYGDSIARLFDIPLPQWGTRAGQGRFFARRSSWPDEWWDFTMLHAGELAAAGVGDLPATLKLLSVIEAGLPHLPSHPLCSLVHFGLLPHHLRVSEHGELVAIEGWEESFAGDPLANWAAAFASLHGEHLRGALEQAGAAGEQAREQAQVLDVYVATYALSFLREAAQQWIEQPTRRSTRALEMAITLAESAGIPAFCQRRLEAIRDSGHSPTPLGMHPGRIVSRVFWTLGSGPDLRTEYSPGLLAALACQELTAAADAPGAEHFFTLGHEFMDRVHPAQGVLRGQLPSADWPTELREALRAAGGGGPALAAGVTAALLNRYSARPGVIPGRCVLGLVNLVHTLLAQERGRRGGAGMQAHQRVLHGLIGWNAALSLGLDEAAEAWKLQLLDALDVLDPIQGPDAEKQSIRDFLPVLTRRLEYVGDGVLVLPAVVAALRLDEQKLLEVQPALLLRTCLALVREPS